MVQTIKEQTVANAWLAQGITIAKAKAMLTESKYQVKLNGEVIKVYGSKVLAIMHTALAKSPKTRVTWSKGVGSSHEATLPNGTIIRFLKTKAKVLVNGKCVQEINYSKRTKTTAVKIINTVSSETKK